MKNPIIVIAHRLPGRIRLKLSHPFLKLENIDKIVSSNLGVENIKYNSITKSVLLEYDQFKISEEEIIVRVVIEYSKGYGFIPIKFISDSPKREMPILSYYSIITIIIASLNKVLTNNANIQDFLNWLTVGTTIGSIGEHAYYEISSKGTVDPEVMSVIYLIKSMLNGDFVKASAITWLTTFGRHILNISYDSILINTKEVKGSCSGESNYEVSVIPSVEDNKKICFLKTFASKVLEKEAYSCARGFLVTKDGIKLGFDKNRTCEFSDKCSYMRVYDNPKKVITNVLNQN